MDTNISHFVHEKTEKRPEDSSEEEKRRRINKRECIA